MAELTWCRREWLMFLTISTILFTVAYYKPDGSTVFTFCLRGLLVLALTTAALHFSARLWSRFFGSQTPIHNRQTCATVIPEDEVNERKARARQQIQGQYESQSSAHQRRVQEREDMARKQKEDSFYQFAGPVWKGSANKLGMTGNARLESSTGPSRRHGSSREAAGMRQLPDHVTNPPRPPPEPKREPRRKLELPVEPSAQVANVVTVVLRTPLGNAHRRRFLTTDRLQVLLDYMTSVGYHPKLYQISSTFPRHCISDDPSLTFADVDLVRDVALNVEEKERD